MADSCWLIAVQYPTINFSGLMNNSHIFTAKDAKYAKNRKEGQSASSLRISAYLASFAFMLFIHVLKDICK
jgi:hypothetical protein